MWLYSASVVHVWDLFLPFTLLWPYSSKVHIVLATAQKKMSYSYLVPGTECDLASLVVALHERRWVARVACLTGTITRQYRNGMHCRFVVLLLQVWG